MHGISSRNGATAPATHTTDLTAQFGIDVQREPRGLSVCPLGEIDLATVGSIRRTIDECVGAGCERVVLDLRGVTFLDCAGVHLILDADAAARAAGWELVLIEGSVPVRRIFELVGVRESLPFVDTPHSPRPDVQRVPATHFAAGPEPSAALVRSTAPAAGR